jgi:hypothetical protein
MNSSFPVPTPMAFRGDETLIPQELQMKWFTAVLCALLATLSVHAEVIESDICVFGATSGGIAAALQAKRMGKTVVLVEPGNYLGGLTTGGLGATDIGNKAAIGGIAREFYQRIARHYAKDAAWTRETRQEYFSKRASGQSRASDLTSKDATMWTFEPHVAEQVYKELLKEAEVRVYFEEQLVSANKDGLYFKDFTTSKGNTFRAKMFIDATYEGDLMPKAGISYHVGREANSVYGETLNGIRAVTPKHQFTVPVDPYVKPGDASSGLLPFIQPGDGGQPGDGDKRVQTYNYRLCFTTNQANRMPVKPPPGYDAAKYELLGRYLEALVRAGRKPKLSEFWNPIWLPNGKTDINNNGGFSTDFIGANYDYPEADYAIREKIAKEHENYMRAFLTFLATSPRVPAEMRAEMKTWGPCKDEFQETGGWPRQLYVREARRMISDYVMTEHNCRGKVKAEDPVGLGAYNMDSHNCQRIVKNGRVENEGDVQKPVRPYPISYRSLTPKAAECANVLVPVCLAASHIAYGSIRMEPVFMILGQSAATAASLAIDNNIAVQAVDYPKLRERLLADKQVLEWKGPQTASAPAALPELKGIVLDDSQGEKVGTWVDSSNVNARRVGSGYVHDDNQNKGATSISYAPQIPADGEYELILVFPPHPNRAANVPVHITIGGRKMKSLLVDQRRSNGYARLGRFNLPQGKSTTVSISNLGTDGYVVADGIQFVPVNNSR